AKHGILLLSVSATLIVGRTSATESDSLSRSFSPRAFRGPNRRASGRLRRADDRPALVGAPEAVDEEHPFAVRQPAHLLHPVVMHLDPFAVSIDAANQPLGTAEREVARDGRVMDHDVHVRLQADIAGYDFLDGLAALGDGSAAVD